MVTSIVLTGEYTIGIDKNEKFQINGKKISIKDVPFVRYRLSEYNENTSQYINKMKQVFKYSAHMAEIPVVKGMRNIVDKLLEDVENLIIYLYVPVTDDTVQNGFSPEMLDTIREFEGAQFDRVMLKDLSSTLYLISANNIKNQIANILAINPSEIGICSSPLSFNTGEACLTAVKARELSAMYTDNDECALPTANHEDMPCCGCIRYLTVNSNLAAPVTVEKVKKENRKNEDTNKTTSKTKVIKNVVPRLW